MERCIRSFFEAATAAELPSFRARVCLNGNDRLSKARLEVLVAEFGGERLEVLYEELRLSPSKARNLLLRGVPEDWIYFVDDDAFVSRDHFTRFQKILAANPDAAAIGGPNIAPPASNALQLASDVVFGSRAGTLFSSARYRGRGKTRACGEESLILCNLFIKGEALFPDPFPNAFVCAEENSLLYRLQRKEHRIFYSPELFNWHERRKSLWPLLKQVFNYGQGRSQFFWTHPRGLRPVHLFPAAAVAYSTYAATVLFFTGHLQFAWIGFFALYALICFVSALTSSLRSKDPAPAWSVLLFPVIHSTYGLGFLYGFFRRMPSLSSRNLFRDRSASDTCIF